MRTSSNNSFSLKVYEGNAALAAIEDPALRGEWQALADLDPKFTAIQEPAFVIAWFRQHTALFEPILYAGHNTQGQLIGLLPLARRRATGGLTHAGDFHAEYHGWIAAPEVDEPFIEECLIAIKNSGAANWAWNWLPPRSPVNFLQSRRLHAAGVFATCETQQSPLWNLDDTDRLDKVLQTKSIKNQFNRYKKLGGFHLERVVDPLRTQELLQICRLQSDFRHAAIHGVRPFADNPLKEPFFVERQNFPAANHFTVLWSNGRPVSFHFGVCDRECVVLGLTAYDPTESRNSPGKLHLLELARLLKSEGFSRIDLTPGGNQYKGFVANDAVTLVKPTFYFNRTDKVRADVSVICRQAVKRVCAIARITPDHLRRVSNAVRSLPSRASKVTPNKVAEHAHRLCHEDVTYLQYAIELGPGEPSAPRDRDVHVQRYEDLLLYKGFNPWLDHPELLRTALKRFSQGETLYTIVADNQLVHYCWLTPGGRTHRLHGVEVEIESPCHSAVVYDGFTHPEYRGRELFPRCIMQILADLSAAHVRQAFIGVLDGNRSSQRAIEKVGFRLFRTFRRERFLWRQTKTETRIAPDYS